MQHLMGTQKGTGYQYVRDGVGFKNIFKSGEYEFYCKSCHTDCDACKAFLKKGSEGIFVCALGGSAFQTFVSGILFIRSFLA